MGGGRLYIHHLHILLALGNIALGDFLSGDALLDSLFDDLVVHVREVGHVIYLIALILHVSAHGIKDNHGSGVADMDKVVNGGTAYIHFHLSLLKGYKGLFFLCYGIIDFHGDSPSLLFLCLFYPFPFFLSFSLALPIPHEAVHFPPEALSDCP